MAETYREIQVTETDSGSPLTSELAEAYRANVLAIAGGASGAPRIQRQGIANNAVTRVKIESGTSSVSGGVGSGNQVNIELDSWSFFPSIVTGTSFSNSMEVAGVAGGSASPNDAKFAIKNNTSVTSTYEVAWRFIADS